MSEAQTAVDVDAWIAEAEARCEAATQGPWGTYYNIHGWHHTIPADSERKVYRRENAEFSAEARTDLPRALRLLRRYREALRWIWDERVGVPDAAGALPIGGAYAGIRERVSKALAYTGEE